MLTRRHLLTALALAVVGLATAPPFPAYGRSAADTGQAATAVAEDRWEPDIRRFEEQDRVAPPAQNGVVFIGSSSIVRWDLASAFPELGAAAIKRGFGGSLMSDAARYADRIVIPYKPRIVVLYEGDNDLASPLTPEQIAREFNRFVEAVHTALPETRIVAMAIKPSLQRWALIDKARAANALISSRCDADPRLTFVDIETPMLGADGRPRPELYVEDGLHMSAEGYRIWNAALRPLLGDR